MLSALDRAVLFVLQCSDLPQTPEASILKHWATCSSIGYHTRDIHLTSYMTVSSANYILRNEQSVEPKSSSGSYDSREYNRSVVSRRNTAMNIARRHKLTRVVLYSSPTSNVESCWHRPLRILQPERNFSRCTLDMLGARIRFGNDHPAPLHIGYRNVHMNPPPNLCPFFCSISVMPQQ